MAIKFTIEELKKLDPCIDGLKWYLKNIKTEDLKEILIQLNNHRPDWSKWLMVRVLDNTQNRKLAIFSAKSVLHIFEEKYPEDKRPREAIEAAQDYLDGKISKEELLVKKRAAAAAYAAADAYAAYAAAYAASAAYAAADAYAAYAAAYAAYAADASAYADAASAYAYADAASAYASAYAYADAAKKDMQEKIINEAIRLKNGRHNGN